MKPNQIMAALTALYSETAIRYVPASNTFYVDIPVEVAEPALGRCFGGTEHRDSPDQALVDFWENWIEGMTDSVYLILDRDDGTRWRGKWNGFMWEEKKKRS